MVIECNISTNLLEESGMDIFQSLRSQALTQSIKQKSNKIFLFDRRKSSTLNQQKLNLLIQQQTPQKNKLSYLDTSLKQYFRQQSKVNHLVPLDYNDEEHEAQLRKKRGQITKKIISNFHFSPSKTKNNDSIKSDDKILRKDFQGQCQIYSLKRSLSKPSEYCQNTNDLKVSNRVQKVCSVNTKNKLVDNFDKRSISVGEVAITAPKTRSFYSPLRNQCSIHEDGIDFLKTGVISGQKIQKTKGQIDKNKGIKDQGEKLIHKNSKSEPDLLTEQYYSLIRKTDYRKMTNYVGKKIIRNNFLSLKSKIKQRQCLKITNLQGQSLIKLQAIRLNSNSIK